MFEGHIISDDKLQYSYFWSLCNASWMIASWGTNIYNDKHIYSFEKFSRSTMHAFAYFFAIVMLYLAFNKDADLSRLFVVSVMTSFAVSLLINRFLHLAVHHFFQNKDHIVRKIMIIGYNDRAKNYAYLEQEPVKPRSSGCEEAKNVYELSHYPIISGLENVIETSKQYKVTEIFSTISPEQQTGIYSMINEADQACIRFRLIPDLSQFIRKPVHIDYLNDMPVLSLRKEPLDDVGNRIKKRLYDIAVSSLVIALVLSWLIPIISLLIWLESRGPIFFITSRKKAFNYQVPA
jgi:putative colanic acid biosynthesis UDP-glucose lipid carrier transferase